ncbi:MAG: glycosyltransferase family 4 protein [bacterium]|nr:glycosyltransferase family 4 protein [bacterium]
MPPGFSGAARNDLLLARELGEHGLRPTLVSHRFPGQERRSEVDGVDVLRLARPVGRLGKLRYPLELVARLAAERPRPEVVRFRGFGLRRAVCAMLCRRLFPGVRIVAQPACFGVDDPASLAATRWGDFKRRQLLAAHGLLAMNREMEAAFEEAGVPARRVATVRNAVDLERFSPTGTERRRTLRRQLDLPTEARIGVTVGGLSKRKEQAWMTAAMAPIMHEDPRLHLLHVGPRAGDLESLGASSARVADARRVERRIDEIGASSGIGARVRLVGLVADVMPFLGAADFFLQAGTKEGEANAVNEAMACALPCVVPREVIFARQVPESASFGFRTVDEGSFQAAVREILGHPDEARAVGLEARRHVEETRAPAVVAREYAAALVTAIGRELPPPVR